MINKNFIFILPLICSNSTVAFAFEDAKVMPAGVRRVSVRTLGTNINQKTNEKRIKQELEKPLEKGLTFKDILKSESNLVKREVAKGFILYGQFTEGESVGTFNADLQSRVTVVAPILTYGLTDNLTFAVAIPVYNMAMSPSLGFSANTTGQKFLSVLADPYNNQIASAREAGEKINDAVGRLNNKLVDNGYTKLQNWNATGLGDVQMLSKIRVVNYDYIKSAITTGVVVPTGRVDDPNILIDKGFGDGQWDLFVQGALDEPLANTGLILNQYIKYTNQLPNKKTVRLVTEDEKIEVEKERLVFKLGDKLEAGASLQLETDSGFNAGVGYNYYYKDKDIYKTPSISRITLEENTFERAHQAEIEISYSGVPAFKRKEIAIPFETKLNYKRQLASQNMPVTHFIQLEAGIFF